MKRLIISFVISLAVSIICYIFIPSQNEGSSPKSPSSSESASPSPTAVVTSPSVIKPSATKSSPRATSHTSTYDNGDVDDLPDTDAPTATTNGTDCAFLKDLIESQEDSNEALEKQINSGTLSAAIQQQYEDVLSDGEETLNNLQDKYDDAGC